MNVVIAVKQYVTKMINDSGQGMKLLLMDKETTSIVSMVYAQSEILQKEVYLFEQIENGNREAMKHMTCICFIRPTQRNVELLSDELKKPSYGSYYIYLSNVLSRQHVKQLAEADDSEVVREIHEMYADYIPLAPHLFSVGMKVTDVIENRTYKPNALNRVVQSIIAVLLSLKCCPAIRYQASSELAKRLADKVRQVTSKEASLFDFRQDSVPLLLILDRREDAITPLLNQWTYEAMVHELIGIQNKRVDLSHVTGVPKDYEQVVLSTEHDPFYAENIYKNFGEIGTNIKALIEEFQKKSHKNDKIESINDMKTFLDNYPQFKKMSGTVGKHVTVVGELSRIVASHKLLSISECEQQIAGGEQSFQIVEQLVSDVNTREIDALRLVLLFALRFENLSTQISTLNQALTRRGINEKFRKLIPGILEYGGQKARYSDTFFKSEPITGIAKRMLKGLKGVENIYTQHKPLLHQILENLFKGQLKEAQYPFVGSSATRQKPTQVFVFIVGGATYEESLYINEFNTNGQFGAKVILGSTYIHNTKSFLEEVFNFMDPSALNYK